LVAVSGEELGEAVSNRRRSPRGEAQYPGSVSSIRKKGAPMRLTQKAAIVASLAAVLAFPATAQADEVRITCDSNTLEIHVGSIDIHVSGDFKCEDRNHRD
jgi:hypothetical protein